MPAQEKDPMEDIKRLLVLLLMKLGSSSDEIALALQVESSGVRKMLSARKVKRIVKSSED